ncbi:MAG TPA: SIR2 family protein [Patescibacteria group bacterium]|nr:SIR2 family protein [Patescibacteria group bacterium]
MTAALLKEVSQGLASRRLAPFLGPACLVLDGPSPLPESSMALVARLNTKVTVPGRIRNNLWSAAQYIESDKHRVTLVRLMQELFGPQPEPTRLHTWLASLDLPLIVDDWYDSLMADALTAAGKTFGQIQGVRRSGYSHDVPWVKRYDAAGAEVETSEGWSTVLYKPQGSVRPAANFLVSDSDYVEVLTEIDIQSPIPAEVIKLRTDVGFVFLGCRFYDQMQRTYAMQITKRSAGPHYAVVSGDLSRNEDAFLERQSIQRIDIGLADAVTQLIG